MPIYETAVSGRRHCREIMEINTNVSITGLNAAQLAQRSKPAPNMLSDRVSLSNSSALEQALKDTPDSRPDIVNGPSRSSRTPRIPRPR